MKKETNGAIITNSTFFLNLHCHLEPFIYHWNEFAFYGVEIKANLTCTLNFPSLHPKMSLLSLLLTFLTICLNPVLPLSEANFSQLSFPSWELQQQSLLFIGIFSFFPLYRFLFFCLEKRISHVPYSIIVLAVTDDQLTQTALAIKASVGLHDLKSIN